MNPIFMDSLARQVENFWGDTSSNLVAEEHGVEIKWLVNIFERFKKKEVTPEDLIFESKSVLNRTWEKLNIGKWMDVPLEIKQEYAVASFFQIIGLLRSEVPNAVEKCLQITDLGILLGYPIPSISLTEVADLLAKYLNDDTDTSVAIEKSTSLEKAKCSYNFATIQIRQPENEVDTIQCPSVEYFYRAYFTQNRPVKLTGCIDHWPALKLWTDLDYIVKKAGCRTVPIEVGKSYTDENYSQKLMKISDYVKDFLRDDASQIGYLAQHQLFDQVPELKRDITEPDYCSLSQNSEASTGETEINAWFGPKGTVSPLHFDPKHNLLCQVVGTKKVILHPQSDSEYLYPRGGTLLFNTSQVDVENPDYSLFPCYRKTVRSECILRPGDVLYIPPKYWHHVRSLESSFSVSFWWE